MNVGKTLFAQAMEFIPWTSFACIVARYSGNAGVRRLSCAEQFRVMAFAQLTWRGSLRDIEVTLGANAHKLYAMGIRNPVHRSTLTDANESRVWRIWADLAAVLIRRARKLYSETDLGLDLSNTVYALDATTIDSCLSLFDWASFRKAKAAVKLHTFLDLRGAIPAFIHISEGKVHEVNVLDILCVEAGAFYAMDRGYLDFKRLYSLHQRQAFFVIRAKTNMRARRIYSAAIDKTNGLICDQTIAMTGYKTSRDYPEHLRRIRFKDPLTDKTFIFLTNNMTLPSNTITAFYKSRWQVELFFKWIKQHLRIKKFLGTTENAVKTQIWCAVSTYVLIAIIKKELQLKASLYTLLQIFSVSVFEKTQLQCALQGDDMQEATLDDSNQLNLFTI
jgi:Transposase DDE domain/Domain of unknown function (DUF4372)